MNVNLKSIVIVLISFQQIMLCFQTEEKIQRNSLVAYFLHYCIQKALENKKIKWLQEARDLTDSTDAR